MATTPNEPIIISRTVNTSLTVWELKQMLYGLNDNITITVWGKDADYCTIFSNKIASNVFVTTFDLSTH